MSDKKKRYNVYYTKYNILVNAYVPYIEVVETDDIYHFIGKMMYTTFEKIDRIRWTEPKASREKCEELWVSNGYVKIDNSGNFWMQETFKETELKISLETAGFVRDFAKWLVARSDSSLLLDVHLMPDYVREYLEDKQ